MLFVYALLSDLVSFRSLSFTAVSVLLVFFCLMFIHFLLLIQSLILLLSLIHCSPLLSFIHYYYLHLFSTTVHIFILYRSHSFTTVLLIHSLLFFSLIHYCSSHSFTTVLLTHSLLFSLIHYCSSHSFTTVLLIHSLLFSFIYSCSSHSFTTVLLIHSLLFFSLIHYYSFHSFTIVFLIHSLLYYSCLFINCSPLTHSLLFPTPSIMHSPAVPCLLVQHNYCTFSYKMSGATLIF